MRARDGSAPSLEPTVLWPEPFGPSDRILLHYEMHCLRLGSGAGRSASMRERGPASRASAVGELARGGSARASGTWPRWVRGWDRTACVSAEAAGTVVQGLFGRQLLVIRSRWGCCWRARPAGGGLSEKVKPRRTHGVRLSAVWPALGRVSWLHAVLTNRPGLVNDRLQRWPYARSRANAARRSKVSSEGGTERCHRGSQASETAAKAAWRPPAVPLGSTRTVSRLAAGRPARPIIRVVLLLA